MQDRKLVAKLGELVTRYPWWIIVFSILWVVGLSIGVKNLEFKSDYRVYFSEDNPQLLAFEAIQDTYSKSDNVLFVIQPADGLIFSKDTLKAISELTEKAWQIPYSSRVDSITNFQHTVAEEDDLIVADLVYEAANLTGQEIEKIKQVAINEPLLVNRLISKTGHVSGVNVTIQLPGKDSLESLEVADKAREIVTEIEMKYPNLTLHLTGVVMMGNAFTEASLNDNATLIPIMYGLVIFVLLLCLRSVIATSAVVLLIVLATIASMGAMGWMKLFLTPTSATAPIIILTLIVADCVHFLVTMLHNMRLGTEKVNAIKESLRINFQPIFLTSVTTAIGFLSMNFSDAPPFRDLGNVVAIGAILALLLTVTFLPALLTVLPIKVKSDVLKKNKPRFIASLAKFVVRRYKGLLFLNTIISIVFISCLPLNELNDEFVKYFDKTIPFRQATDFLNENMGGIYSIEYSIAMDESGAVNEPEFLKKIDQFSYWLKQQSEVIHVNTVSDTFKRLNKSMHADEQAWYKLPEQRDLAAQYLLMYEMSLPYGLDLNDQVNMDKSGIRVVITIQSLSSNEVLALEVRFSEWLATQMPTAKFDSASTDLMFANIGKRNIVRMIEGTGMALILISLILVFAFKSIRLGLISLIPNLVPAGIAFGIWGVVNGNVGLALSVVTGITLGIVVDDTVHFMSKYQRARIEKGYDKKQAVEYAFSTVGTALWITSAVLVSGFIVLGFSHFTMNVEMGVMTAMTIAIALFLDLLFLPPLLISLDKK
ncbi:MAG: MMPL family transporter [Methylococcaceae bacterium]|nr:MMPL family transporter [Methylococcaceae bacterium]